MHKIKYNIGLNQAVASHGGSLVDRGANAGLFGTDDVLILEESTTFMADVTSIGNKTLESLPISQGAAYVETSNEGPIIAIFSQYANGAKVKQNKTVHSVIQMEAFQIDVCDKHHCFGGR